MKLSLENMLERLKSTDNVVIVGAGKRGRALRLHLKCRSVAVAYFFDNNQELCGNDIGDVKIVKPYKIENGTSLYVIAVDGVRMQEEFLKQLCSLGIAEHDIMRFDRFAEYDYLSKLDEKYYPMELQEMFFERFGRKIDWNHPVTYNEKVNCDKINCREIIRTQLADKYLVRDWIKEKIGEQYLNKLYGVWDDADDIDFDKLPNAFALKVNNGSGRNIIVKDKSQIDQDIVRRRLNDWKNNNYAFQFFELQYKDIVPKIICEAYLDGMAESLYDYNIYCFHGEPEYIWCIKGSHKPDCRASFYTKNWEMMPFSFGYPKDNVLAPRPINLDKMLELSRVLSKDFKHVRVDWYNLPDGRVLFGEMTFMTWGGMYHFEPEEWDTYFGSLI